VIEGAIGGDTPATLADLDLDPERVALGETIFNNGAEAAPNCVACHVSSGEDSALAPALIGQWDRLASRDSALSVREYVRQSVLRPNETVAEGYNAGVMYQDYAVNLTEEQINAVVEYTLSIAAAD